MAKASTLVLYITLSLVVLILISLSPSKLPHRRASLHRRLKLRSSFDPRQHSPIPFDPIIAEIERRRQDRLLDPETPGAEAQPEWEDFMNAEDYLNDEERFNVTRRILLLFPKIDQAPSDGFVTAGELADWNLRTARSEEMHRTLKEVVDHDKNGDGFVSFQEYEPPSWSRKLPGSDDGNSYMNEMGWWKENHFKSADEDGDGLLNQTEFNNFLHPVDSNNPKLLQWLCKEEIRERDTDKDGKLNFKEFFHGLFDSIRDYDAHNSSFESNDSTEVPAKRLYAELDRNNDGYLSDEELLPVIDKIHPSEHYYAKEQADYAISQADADHDGRLSLEEMIENPYVFYTAIFSDEDEDDFHDEFR